jgi:hypothetical protein
MGVPADGDHHGDTETGTMTSRRVGSDRGCIVISQAFKTWIIAQFNGLGGVIERIQSRASIDKACFCHCL